MISPLQPLKDKSYTNIKDKSYTNVKDKSYTNIKASLDNFMKLYQR